MTVIYPGFESGHAHCFAAARIGGFPPNNVVIPAVCLAAHNLALQATVGQAHAPMHAVVGESVEGAPDIGQYSRALLQFEAHHLADR